LGDPLYRPFARLDGPTDIRPEDRDYVAIRLAALQWKDDPTVWQQQMGKAVERTGSAILAEAIGLKLRERNLNAEAKQWFANARNRYVASEDKLRQDFHVIAIDRATGRKDDAIRGLRDARLRYGPIPESDALTGWLNVLDPPPASPVQAPRKSS
jgi:hypothetical protein